MIKLIFGCLSILIRFTFAINKFGKAFFFKWKKKSKKDLFKSVVTLQWNWLNSIIRFTNSSNEILDNWAGNFNWISSDCMFKFTTHFQIKINFFSFFFFSTLLSFFFFVIIIVCSLIDVFLIKSDWICYLMTVFN